MQIRLYEQEPGEALASARLGLYAQPWLSWTVTGLNLIVLRQAFDETSKRERERIKVIKTGQHLYRVKN